MWTLYFTPCGFFFFFFLLFLACSQRSETGCLPYFHACCGLSAHLECRPEICCTRLAANGGRKIAQKSPSAHHHTNLSGYIFAKSCINNRKKLVKQQYLLHVFQQYGNLRSTKKPNSITLAGSELVRSRFGAGSELKFGLSSSLLAAN